MSDKIILKHLVGMPTSSNMKENPEWLDHWTNIAANAEKEGKVLAVWALNSRLIPEVEQFIQSLS